MESIKQKISHKDSYIQSQSNRILQLQTKNEKSSAEINTFIKNKSVSFFYYVALNDTWLNYYKK